MKYLFVHQNFPGQYRHLVQHLVAQGHEVTFITQPNNNAMPGVTKLVYPRDTRQALHCHAYTVEIDRAIHAGAAVADVCRRLREEGYRPGLVVGHSGWGETLFIKDVFADTPLLANFEFFYQLQGGDVGFDPEYASSFHDPSKLRARNAVNLLAYDAADWGHAATAWQRSLYPATMHERIAVLHEGVDTTRICPNPRAAFTLPSGRVLTASDEVVTYVARNLEPYRGFHVFMRSLPAVLRRRPRAQVVIVGGDGVSYGAPAPPDASFRELLLKELQGELDLRRVHFTGQIAHHLYLDLLRISSAHVYLTYPFVLSWSFIEALASGCLVIGSATPSVLEVLRDGVNGIAVDFFDTEALAGHIVAALAAPRRYLRLREAARRTAVSQFDLHGLLLPRWMKLLQDLAGDGPSRDRNVTSMKRSKPNWSDARQEGSLFRGTQEKTNY